MRILRASDRVAAPWKNGAGITREVAVWPPDAGFEDFHWRISQAEMNADAPFSVFAGVDRNLTLLQGRLALSFDAGREVVRLAPFAPFAFPGERPVAGMVEEGPISDLNVMTRRGVVRAKVERLRTAGTLDLHARPFVRVLFAQSEIQVSQPLAAKLERHDAVLLEPGDQNVAISADDGTAFLVTFEPSAASNLAPTREPRK